MLRSDLGRQAAAAALAVLFLATGCAAAGHPIPEQPDLARMDTGPFGVDPLRAPRNDSEANGRVLESVRMGEAVIDPIEAEPALTFGLGTAASVPIPTPGQAGFLAQPVRAVLEKHGMLAGFSVGGMDADVAANVAVGRARLLTVMLLRFPDAAAAQRAAADIDAVDAAVSPDNVAVRLPEHAGAFAHWRPTVPTLAATLADGPFVISLLAGHTAPDLNVLTALARAAFTAQTARLREFTPTPRDKLATLPLDEAGFLARVLPDVPGVWPVPRVISDRGDENAGWRTVFRTSGIVYGPRATHRYGPWEKSSKTGTMQLARSGTNELVRYAGAVNARAGFVETAYEVNDPGLRPAPTPVGVPDVRCVESLTKIKNANRFACRVLFGRYNAIVFARTLKLAHQKIAAQYVLLVRSE
ncbi:hypothetical protein AB0H76_09175 [Nocardia sp. NPDC050712]|uniref:DUF7373 family lipoprotein n=1 Tax=Nocardia sp. NPDC050712 TaxID=3155518 RepID=UPI003405F13D